MWYTILYSVYAVVILRQVDGGPEAIGVGKQCKVYKRVSKTRGEGEGGSEVRGGKSPLSNAWRIMLRYWNNVSDSAPPPS